MVKRISNVSLAEIRKLLKNNNCKLIRTRGGHETWSRVDLLRPIIIQSHVDPVPRHIVKQILRHLNLDISALG